MPPTPKRVRVEVLNSPHVVANERESSGPGRRGREAGAGARGGGRGMIVWGDEIVQGQVPGLDLERRT